MVFTYNYFNVEKIVILIDGDFMHGITNTRKEMIYNWNCNKHKT